MGDLERRIGFRLFHRKHRQLIPTDEARIFFREVQRTYSGVEHLAATAEAIRTCNAGTLRVITMPFLGSRMLPQIMVAFHRHHPEVTMTLEIQPRAQIIECMRGQRFDIGITILPVEDSSIRSSLFARAEVACLLPADHRLARKSAIHAADLRGEKFVSFCRDSYFRSLVDEVFTQAGIERDMIMEVRTAEAIYSMVCDGVGLTVTAPIGVPEAMETKMAVRRFEPSMKLSLGVIWSRHKPLSRVAEAFTRVVAEYRSPLLEPIDAPPDVSPAREKPLQARS